MVQQGGLSLGLALRPAAVSMAAFLNSDLEPAIPVSAPELPSPCVCGAIDRKFSSDHSLLAARALLILC